jgi:hypothetical protein
MKFGVQTKRKRENAMDDEWTTIEDNIEKRISVKPILNSEPIKLPQEDLHFAPLPNWADIIKDK